MWGDGPGIGGWRMGLMMLFWILLIGVAILGGIWLARRGIGERTRSDAQEILRERLARGEIDVAEYEERRKTLEK
ncbi:SHOCT domain-containing protein [Stappia taiwanensis]|uniref:SHOCT domain-containing protein n=2 Tax=Stappia taiwanensis TaxID=992267 RepID=A0A838XX29_9HYPH|nr:SHOCT domain-containing protein [Stappia taiwanensis]